MITGDHVRELLGHDAEDAVLVLLGGQVEVVRSAELDSGRCRGAMTVVSRRDLLARLDADRSEPDPEALAAALDATVRYQGG
ncbi:hypothetical protein QQY24_07610 [Streptomyces sp. TG1A-8]|uniref:hypothetical protein n=1 Tax=Streptomyces sp. TG1A-8 TaxID=3051385 RepID=UPI00265BE948|nr:hypothetical protein [Streptomyces sp. TG1A-8]MDO0925293.1 hypothetical protein [Streptomyces sp. TG1A-8]